MFDSNPHESYPTYTITILNNLPNLITILYLKNKFTSNFKQFTVLCNSSHNFLWRNKLFQLDLFINILFIIAKFFDF